jgi:hypothetical protein
MAALVAAIVAFIQPRVIVLAIAFQRRGIVSFRSLMK